MIKETLTFNAENWSGQELTVEVVHFANTYEWEMFGHKLALVSCRRFGAFVQYSIQVDGKPTDHLVGKDDGDKQWEAANWGGSISRFGNSPAEAAAKLMASLL